MSEYPASFDHMLSAWNERDPEKIRGHLDKALSPDVHFIDPSIETRGIEEFEANVRGFRAKYPEGQCSRASVIDSHHTYHRYAWAIHNDGALMLPGFDMVETDAEGRVLKVVGFFGPLPAA